MNRRSTLALLLLGAGAVFPFVAPSAHADTVEQAWWNLANAGAAPPPNPPDVGKTDLLIQFGDTTGAYSGISNQQGTGASAITAVAFTLPDGECCQLRLRFRSIEIEMMPRTETSPPMSMNPVRSEMLPLSWK